MANHTQVNIVGTGSSADINKRRQSQARVSCGKNKRALVSLVPYLVPSL